MVCVGGGGYVNDNRHGGDGCRWDEGRGLCGGMFCVVYVGSGGLHCECVEAAVDYGYGACYE